MHNNLENELVERQTSMIIEIDKHIFRTVREDAYYYVLRDIKTGIYYYVLRKDEMSIIDEVHDLSHELNRELLDLTEVLGIDYDEVDTEYSGIYHMWQNEHNKQ